jgi:hypothetical protein
MVAYFLYILDSYQDSILIKELDACVVANWAVCGDISGQYPLEEKGKLDNPSTFSKLQILRVDQQILTTEKFTSQLALAFHMLYYNSGGAKNAQTTYYQKIALTLFPLPQVYDPTVLWWRSCICMNCIPAT